jgi:hypothetical protein
MTMTPLGLFNASATPLSTVTPHVITLRHADVRSGPGFHYDLSHSLNAGTNAPVQGRSADRQWCAVPGPGDGPWPLGWIHTADVQFYGDLNQVVILPAQNPGDWPVHTDSGSPPANACSLPTGNRHDDAEAWHRRAFRASGLTGQLGRSAEI